MFFRKKEFHIENVKKLHRKFPRHFQIPYKVELDVLEAGDLVKLIFVPENKYEKSNSERLWVKITSIDKKIIKGTLDNTPDYLKTIFYGDKIAFKRKNIASIYYDYSDTKLKILKSYGTISEKALEMREINYLVHIKETEDQNNSGWHFFYGDEDEQYCQFSNNFKFVQLIQLLSFEPLLEKCFFEHGKEYEFSKEINQFIVVRNDFIKKITSFRKECNFTKTMNSEHNFF